MFCIAPNKITVSCFILIHRSKKKSLTCLKKWKLPFASRSDILRPFKSKKIIETNRSLCLVFSKGHGLDHNMTDDNHHRFFKSFFSDKRKGKYIILCCLLFYVHFLAVCLHSESFLFYLCFNYSCSWRCVLKLVPRTPSWFLFHVRHIYSENENLITKPGDGVVLSHFEGTEVGSLFRALLK